MANVTINMDDETLAWVRLQAARRAVSVSRWLAQFFEAERSRAAASSAAIEAFLSGPEIPTSTRGRLMSREEIYADRLRRLERGDLQPGSEDAVEDEPRRQLAEEPGRFEFSGDQQAGDP